jgi:rubrerythrin
VSQQFSIHEDRALSRRLSMIAQRTTITGNIVQDNDAVVREAMRLLSSQPSTQRWVCEVCGMIHTVAAPDECDSCGAPALVQYHDFSREMNSRW